MNEHEDVTGESKKGKDSQYLPNSIKECICELWHFQFDQKESWWPGWATDVPEFDTEKKKRKRNSHIATHLAALVILNERAAPGPYGVSAEGNLFGSQRLFARGEKKHVRDCCDSTRTQPPYSTLMIHLYMLALGTSSACGIHIPARRRA